MAAICVFEMPQNRNHPSILLVGIIIVLAVVSMHY